MNEDELSWEEQRRLYDKCAIPLIIVMYAFIGYLVYLMRTDPLKIGWDFFIRLGLPLSFIWPTALLLTFEILYHRKIRKPAAFHMKRFARRMLGSLAIVLPGFLLMCVSAIVFSEALGEFYATFLGISIWLFMIGIVVFKLGKRRLRKVLEQT